MNADQGFRRAPGSLLRVAAGAGAAALIVTAVSTARRAGTARANRDSGPAQDSQVPPSASPVSQLRADVTGPGVPSGPLAMVTAQATPDISPSPAAPESAKAGDLAVGQIAVSAALLLFTATALPAIVGRRRDGGKRGAAHARTSRRQAENGDDAFPPEIPADIGDPWIIGAPRSVRPDPTRHYAGQAWHEVQRSQHADDYPSWPGSPGPNALHPDHPSWGGGRADPRWDATEQALRQDGYPSWPEPAAPPWRDAEPPAVNDSPGWRGGGTPVRQGSMPAPHRGSHGRSATGSRPVLPAPVGTNYAPRAGYAPRARSAAAPGPAPWLASAPSAGYAPRPGYAPQGFAPQPGYAPGPGSAAQADFVPRHGPVLQQGATGVMERGRPEVDRVMPTIS
jgi:hypothetical protein